MGRSMGFVAARNCRHAFISCGKELLYTKAQDCQLDLNHFCAYRRNAKVTFTIKPRHDDQPYRRAANVMLVEPIQFNENEISVVSKWDGISGFGKRIPCGCLVYLHRDYVVKDEIQLHSRIKHPTFSTCSGRAAAREIYVSD
jgi:hypothetical protein